jgi:predicted Zn-dependent peptidase
MAPAIHAEVDQLVNQDISDSELKMVKTRLRADLIRGLGSNEGLAQSLASFQALYGDWRELFRQVDRYDKVTKADIRRVATKVFTPDNRTVAFTETVLPAKAPGGQQ